MARIDLTRRAVLDLVRDLDYLDYRTMCDTDLSPQVVARVQPAARQTRAHLVQQIAHSPQDFECEPLLEWINDVRSKLDRAMTELRHRPQEVGEYVEKVHVWASSLPGNRTTPPP